MHLLLEPDDIKPQATQATRDTQIQLDAVTGERVSCGIDPQAAQAGQNRADVLVAHLLLEPDDVVLALGLHTLRCALHRPQKHQPPRRPEAPRRVIPAAAQFC